MNIQEIKVVFLSIGMIPQGYTFIIFTVFYVGKFTWCTFIHFYKLKL